MEKLCSQCQGVGFEAKACGNCNGKGKVPVDKSKDKSNTQGAQHYSAHDKEEYSKKNNKTIVQMKNDGKSWQEILDAIGKQSKSQLQAHYKANLQDKVNQGDNDTGAQNFSAHDKEEYSKNNNKTIIQMKNAGKTWQEILDAIGKQSKSQLQAHYKANLQDRAEQVQQGGSGGADGGSSSGKVGHPLLHVVQSLTSTQGNGGGRQNDGVLENVGKHLRRFWQNVAAEHYDLTGERITVEEAREIYEK